MKKEICENLVKNACYANGWPVSAVVGAIKREMVINLEYMMQMNAHKIPQEYYHRIVMESEGLWQ